MVLLSSIVHLTSRKAAAYGEVGEDVGSSWIHPRFQEISTIKKRKKEIWWPPSDFLMFHAVVWFVKKLEVDRNKKKKKKKKATTIVNFVVVFH